MATSPEKAWPHSQCYRHQSCTSEPESRSRLERAPSVALHFLARMGFMTRLRSIGQFLAVVEVPLRVRVRDRRTSIVYWIAQSLVLLYGGIYMFGKQRGYQASGDIAFSSEFRFTGSVSISKPTGVQVSAPQHPRYPLQQAPSGARQPHSRLLGSSPRDDPCGPRPRSFFFPPWTVPGLFRDRPTVLRRVLHRH